jgi:3-phenylpropionate/trans-cinnamate dioxygenase ferredoxin reductase subunit
MTRRIIIVGAGRAGASAAAALRSEGFDGRIQLFGEEAVHPYERPPLSKGVLAGRAPSGAELVFPAAFYDEQRIELVLDRGVRSIHRDRREIVADNGAAHGYDHLILATGARARELPLDPASAARVIYLRTASDATALAAGLASCTRVAIIGAGVIGLEVAAAAIAAGKPTAVIELAPRVMARVLPPALSDRLARHHEGHGVRILTGRRTLSIDGDGARPSAVVLEDGERVLADLVVAGVGAAPRTTLAQSAALAVDDGILVDAFGATSDATISAIGDAARFFHPLFERTLRVESWQHAQRHAAAVARNVVQVVAQERAVDPYLEVPWMWSDQLGLELQVAGIIEPTAVLVERPLADGGLMMLATERGRVRGAAALGPEGSVGRELRLAQMLIAAATPVADAALADPAIKLKSLLRAVA